jgi:hypothetical protein
VTYTVAQQRILDLVGEQPLAPVDPVEVQLATLNQRVAAIETDLGNAPAKA